MRTRVVGSIWTLAVSLVVVGAIATTWVDLQGLADLPFGFGFLLLGIGAATAGAIVTARVPRNAVGPILLAMGLGLGLLLTSGAYAEISLATDLGPLPAAVWAAWLGGWLSVPVLFGLTAFLLLLFPTGRLISRGWRWAAWFTATGVASATASSAFSPRRLSLGFDNPMGAPAGLADAVLALNSATDLLALPVLLIAALALVTRLRRSHGVERLQLKWFTYVAALAGAGLGLSVLTRGIAADLAFLWALLALTSLPLVAGVAVFRHGLYDIDLVIKRTLVYGALTAVLVSAYLGLVLVFRLALRPVAGDSDLAVAASTLAVAALFRPLRSQIQSVVDRRFFRQRYDTARVLESFSERLRQEVDLKSVSVDLCGVVHETVHPAHVSLWLREVRR